MQLCEYEHENSSVVSLAFSPSGTFVASGSEDHLVKLVELGSGNEVREWKLGEEDAEDGKLGDEDDPDDEDSDNVAT